MKPSGIQRARAVDALADVRASAPATSSSSASDEEPGRELLPGRDRHLERQQRRRRATAPMNSDVAHQEMARARSARTCGLSGSATEAEYTITRPNAQQRHRDPDQRLVEAQHARRRCAPRARCGARRQASRRALAAISRKPAACRSRSRVHAGLRSSAQRRCTAATEHLGAVRVVAEHVEAGAGRRQQHGVAGVRALRGERARPASSVARRPAARRRPARARRGSRRVAADQHHGARVARAPARPAARSPGPCRRRRGSRTSLRSRAQALSAATVAPTLVPLLSSKYSTPSTIADQLDAVRLAAVFAQAVQHRRRAAADRRGQRQRGQRIERRCGGRGCAARRPASGAGSAARRPRPCGACSRLVGLERAHQPGHAVDDLDAEVAGPLRHVGAEA